MQVQFDKPLCPKHKLPINYICSDSNCPCSVKICLKCAQEHRNKTDIEEDFIKTSVYSKKVEIETEIIAKQYSHLKQYQMQKKESSLLSSQNEDSIQYVEQMMRRINEDKRTVLKSLEEFNFSHFEVKKKLNKVKTTHLDHYLTKITKNKMVSMVVYLSNESGLARLRKKVVAAHGAIQKYGDFMNAVKKYGTTPKEFMEGLGCREQNLVRKKIENLIGDRKGQRKPEMCFDRARMGANLRRINKASNSRDPRPVNHNESPRKRISLFGGQKPPSGKEN